MPVAPFITGLPGVRAAVSATHKIVFKRTGQGYLQQGWQINGALSRDPTNTPVSVLQPGVLMGKITATGLYAPSILGVTTVAFTSGGTEITVGAATAVELVRRIGSSGTFKLIGPPTAAGTVAATTTTFSAVNTSTGVITVTNPAADFIAGSFISPTDGSDVPLTFIPDGYGICVVDSDGSTNLTVEFPEMPIEGVVDSSQLVNWPSDTSLQTRLIGQLNASGAGHFTFDHLY